MSLRLLMELTKMNQATIARLVGVTHVAVTHWCGGKLEPRGITRATINVACAVAADCPELMYAILDAPSPADPHSDIARFFGTDAGLHYWLGITADALVDARISTPLARLAVLLNLTAALMPAIQARMVRAYPRTVERIRQAQIEAVKARDEKNKAKKKRNREITRRMRELGKDT